MRNRIQDAFSKKAKIAYLTAGDIGLANHVDDLRQIQSSGSPRFKDEEYFIALAKGGANILEIGIPFSDPVADGSVIQFAMERSLKNGTNLDKVLSITKRVRDKTDVAIILFTYFNQIQHDLVGFLRDVHLAGADGLLVVDLPYEESEELLILAKHYDLSIIFVAAPSTSLDRIKLLSSKTNGFLYYACRKGTTGVRDGLSMDIEMRIKEVCANSVIPVAVGFGIANSTMVETILSIADGCVVGSYFVNAIANGASPNSLEKLARNLFGSN